MATTTSYEVLVSDTNGDLIYRSKPYEGNGAGIAARREARQTERNLAVIGRGRYVGSMVCVRTIVQKHTDEITGVVGLPSSYPSEEE